MRATIILLGTVLVVVAVLVACRPRDDSSADTATDDTARADGSASDSTAPSGAPVPPTTVPAKATSRPSTPEVQRARAQPTDSTLVSEDSIRAIRPELPQVKPGKRSRTWRGFKLPEEMPVRPPVQPSIRRVEPIPDSVMKGDSTKPLKPPR